MLLYAELSAESVIVVYVAPSYHSTLTLPPRIEFQAIFNCEPIVNISFPTGFVRTMPSGDGSPISKNAPSSVMRLSLLLVILMLYWFPGANPVMLQGNDPLLSAASARLVCHTLLNMRSILTVPAGTRFVAQVICLIVWLDHFSPPAGDVTLTKSGLAIEKRSSLMSDAGVVTPLILTLYVEAAD